MAAVWPQALLLLCVFHFAKAVVAWLWNSKNNIQFNKNPEKNHRNILYEKFEAVLYSETEIKVLEKIECMKRDKTYKRYPNFQDHINKLLERREEWAIYLRREGKYPTHNINTTNYVEVSFRTTKDRKLNRLREYNLMSLVETLADDDYLHSTR